MNDGAQSVSKSKPFFVFGCCLLAYMLCGTMSTMMSSYLPVAVPMLLGGQADESTLGEIGAYINAVFLYGWMVGGLVFGLLSDTYGRKPILILVTFLAGLFTLLTVFVPDWKWLLVFRFFTGAGIGGVLLLTTVYISEIWPEKSRAVALGILAVSFPVGIVSSGLLNVYTKSWRDAFWLGLLPLVLVLCFIFYLKESPSWQSSTGGNSIRRRAMFGKDNAPFLILGSLVYGLVLIGLWGIFSWLPTWVQEVLPEGADGGIERGTVMMLLGAGGILGGVLSGFFIRIIGDTRTLMVSFCGCVLACGILFLTNPVFSALVYFETAFLSLFFGISQGALSSFIPGLFPSSIRGSCTGFCFNIGRLFTATAVFFVGALVDVFGGFSNALLTFSVTFFAAFLVLFFRNKITKTSA